MRNSHLSSVITAVQTHKRKLLSIDDIKQLFASHLGTAYNDKKCYKLIYYLKNKGYLYSLKKDIFYAKLPSDTTTEQEVMEQYYRQILHTHCTTVFGKWYIGGIKALELLSHNTDIPESILIINPVKQSIDTVVTGKTLHAKTYTYQKKNLFGSFNKFTQKIKIGRWSFPIAAKELAILECLFSYDETTDRYAYEYIKKLVKKIELDMDVLEKTLMLGKHHTSVNRLLDLLKQVKPKAAEQLTQLIKKHSFILSL